MSQNPAEKTDLGRKLGLGAVLALGVGTTVGSGIFSSLSEVAGAAGSSLFFLTGIARDYNNVPVEFFKSVARPDMVRFSSILRKYRTEPERR